MMNRVQLISATAAVFLLTSGGAVAQEADGPEVQDDVDVTMSLMPEEAARQDVVTRTIELPEAAADEGVENSEDGLAAANEARERRAEGLQTAAEAREQGRDFGEEMAEQARESARSGDVAGVVRELSDEMRSGAERPAAPVTPPAR